MSKQSFHFKTPIIKDEAGKKIGEGTKVLIPLNSGLA